jgi:hypothetical protein
MNTNKKTARTAGFLYLSYILMTILGTIVSSGLVVSGDAAATASQIMASEWRFRIGFLSELVAGGLFLLTAWALYVLLKPVHKNLAILFVFLNLGGVAVQSINTLNLFAPLLLLVGGGYFQVFPAGQLQALTMLFLDLHDHGFMLAQLFYGAWVFPLGWLVYKSGFLPKILGILLMADCFAVLVWFIQFFLFPGYEAVSYPFWAVSFVAEVSLTLWLLIKGVKNQEPA